MRRSRIRASYFRNVNGSSTFTQCAGFGPIKLFVRGVQRQAIVGDLFDPLDERSRHRIPGLRELQPLESLGHAANAIATAQKMTSNSAVFDFLISFIILKNFPFGIRDVNICCVRKWRRHFADWRAHRRSRRKILPRLRRRLRFAFPPSTSSPANIERSEVKESSLGLSYRRRQNSSCSAL